MGYIDAIILGIIQGATEFIPVSSSGHLIVVRDVFGVATESGLSMDVFLHAATLAALLVYFASDIKEIFLTLGRAVTGRQTELSSQRLLMALIVGTIPAAMAGYFLESLVTSYARNTTVVVFSLLVGSILFVAAEYAANRWANRVLTAKRGFVIGCFQVLALIPGTSRSGITIAGGLFAGLSRREATRFAFLLGIPVIAGAGLKTLIEGEVAFSGPSLTGAVTAFAVGLAAIHFLVTFLDNHSLRAFAIYRAAVAVLVFTMMI